MNRTGGAEQLAGTGERMGAQVAADVDHRQPRGSDALGACEDEVGVAVAVGIDPLDVDDPAAGGLAAGDLRRAARRLDPLWLGLGLRTCVSPRLGVVSIRVLGAAAARGDETGGERQAG